MRNTDDRRATYHQSRQKALAQADNLLAVEAVRLQAEAVVAVTGWSEFQALAEAAVEKQQSFESDEAAASRLPPVDAGDVNHE
ncbi:hypothetical protein [Salinisphaera sp. Q1T1-3]|uniref:hypothetical protein n=1 Tax=Salinisphaera sp. Q1T1-3 TaxID=2321229 RepID=UPI000E742EE3|nr:hypothetical protein [Salinisphaera sp. Q1T1-3]RJS92391.1 hypothetical protein D3260_12170 [Salinisphaera sp. Q1T1-3]